MIYADRLDGGALESYAAALNGRAGRAKAAGRLTAAGLRDRILESGGRCEWCAVDLWRRDFELDHIVSLRAGGANTAINLVVACPDCNRRKGRKHPARFAAEICREQGKQTKLIARLLRRHGLEARRQMKLFAEGGREPAASVGAGGAMDPIPPYTWAESAGQDNPGA